MTNEEATYRRTMRFLNLGQMAGKTLFTAWHSIDYDITKVLSTHEVKTIHSLLVIISLPTILALITFPN